MESVSPLLHRYVTTFQFKLLIARAYRADMGSITPECNNITITFKLLLLLLLLVGHVGQM